MPRPLAIAGCQALCAWHATGDRLDGEPLFACRGCGSEWVPSEQWTPVDHTGVVPEPVRAARPIGTRADIPPISDSEA